MTKYQMMQEFFDLVISGKGFQLQERTFKLWEDGKVTYGWYLTKNVFDNYHYEELMKVNYKRHTKWEINYHLSNLKKHIEEALVLVEEQETLPIELCQKQVLIKNKQIIYS